MTPQSPDLILQPQAQPLELLDVFGLGETLTGIDQLVKLAVLTNELAQVGFHEPFIDRMRHLSILTQCDDMNVPICRPIIQSSIIEFCDKQN